MLTATNLSHTVIFKGMEHRGRLQEEFGNVDGEEVLVALVEGDFQSIPQLQGKGSVVFQQLLHVEEDACQLVLGQQPRYENRSA